MRTKLVSCAVLALSLTGGAQAATLADTFTSFYVLGDSNSDPGNFGPNGPPPPYFNGQFSNGPVWADIIDDDFETGDPDNIRTENYAFGGARVTEDSDAPDLPLQLQLFAADLDPNIPDPLFGTPVLGDRPLLSVWFGANDIRSIYQDYEAAIGSVGGLAQAAQEAALAQAADVARAAAAQTGAIYGSTLELMAQDPRLSDLLSFTTADAGLTPEYASANFELLTELSLLFNAELDASLSRIETLGVNVYSVDVFAIQQQVFADPSRFGVEEVREPCLTLEPGGLAQCSDPETYLYWDEVGHLSGAAHAILAEIVTDTVLSAQPAPVPLPAGLPLMLAGLGGLATLRCRKPTR